MKSTLKAMKSILRADEYRVENIKPSDWAELNRIMSSDVSPFPGPFSFDRTPYTREILDRLSLDDPVKYIVFQKGAQIGISTGLIENAIGYIIARMPGPIFFTTGDEDLVKQAMNVKIDNMIDSCNLRHLIRPNTFRKRNSRTGDTSKEKEFAGGRLQAGVTSQHNKLRQVSMQFGFMDDWESAPMATKQMGATMPLIDQRFAAYYDKMKVFFISTPEVKHTSNIEPLYNLGDQRRWFVPCPNCGELIVLEWSIKNDNGVFGIYYKLDQKGKLIDSSVGYRCQCCGEVFKDSKKYEMNLNGEWRPTVDEPTDPDYSSYHLSALYAPPGMKNWLAYVKQYLKACPPDSYIRHDEYKVFRNLCLGETWEERGEVPQVKRLAGNTRHYTIGNVPTQLSRDDGNGEIVMVTLACDLNGHEDDARLDWEIVAWSQNESSYGVSHGSVGTFLPATDKEKKTDKWKKREKERKKWTYRHHQASSVWPAFMEIIMSELKTDEPDRMMKINIAGVDVGHFTELAHEFIRKVLDQGKTILGLKGDKPENFVQIGLDKPVFHRSRQVANLYLVDVNTVKDQVSALMKLRWDYRSGNEQPFGFMNFPQPGDGKYTMKEYFDHFASESKVYEKGKDGNMKAFLWRKRSSTVMNHMWDCRIYNEALRHILAYIVCLSMNRKNHDWYSFCKIILEED